MTQSTDVVVMLPADVNMVDETNHVWTSLHEASEPDRVFPGALIVAGDTIELFLARVVDIIDGPNGTQVVHLEVLGVPEDRSTSCVTLASCPRGSRTRAWPWSPSTSPPT